MLSTNHLLSSSIASPRETDLGGGGGGGGGVHFSLSIQVWRNSSLKNNDMIIAIHIDFNNTWIKERIYEVQLGLEPMAFYLLHRGAYLFWDWNPRRSSCYIGAYLFWDWNPGLSICYIGAYLFWDWNPGPSSCYIGAYQFSLQATGDRGSMLARTNNAADPSSITV